jgi:hypothetical protein
VSTLLAYLRTRPTSAVAVGVLFLLAIVSLLAQLRLMHSRPPSRVCETSSSTNRGSSPCVTTSRW